MIVAKFRSSIWTRVVISCAHTKILLRIRRGLQNTIEGQGKDLVILVALQEDWYLCPLFDLLSLTKGNIKSE